MRAAIYARFSTDLQQERSIDDQIALCRLYAERSGLSVITTYTDRARSGASTIGRGGLLDMMAAARNREFDVVVVEALDRLSRDQEDLAGIWKRLQFLGIEIRAVHEGTADAIQIGVRGLVGALYLQDLAHKVRRGMTGIIRDGRHAGGRAYGYRPVAGKRGEMQIVDTEAEVIRRIFALYLDGTPPRDIAGRLNREGVPPPRGSKWNASTINGSPQRGSGILHNELYAGRMVWNKVRMLKNPDTGRRISRPNARTGWQSVAAPHLAIVAPEVFDAVQARRAANAQDRPQSSVRPRRLLSGLLKCGACGGGMAVHGTDKTGKTRVQCSVMRESGSCTHRRSYYLEAIEQIAVDGLRAELRDPRLIREFVETYCLERKRLSAAAATRRGRLERELGEVQRALARLVDAIASGLGTAETVGERILALETDKIRLRAALAEAPQATDAVALHPTAVARYLEQVTALSQALGQTRRVEQGSAAAWFRSLVESVIVHPVAAKQPLEVELRGYLSVLLSEPRLPPSGLHNGFEVVAEAGLEPATSGL